jgi:transposase
MEALKENERTHLKTLQKTTRNKKIYVRVTSLLMLDKGYNAQETAELLGIDDGTVYKNWERWQKNEERDLEKYLMLEYKGYKGRLCAAEKEKIKNSLEESLCINSQEVINIIKEQTNKCYTKSGAIYVLKKLGYVYKKTKIVGEKVDVAKQNKWVEEIKTVYKTLKKEEVLLFADACHPEHQTRSDYGWIAKGKEYEVCGNIGKNRVNLIGAVDIKNPTKIQINTFETIDNKAVMIFFEQLKKANVGKHIKLVCDNARYFHAKEIKTWLTKNQDFELIFLPPYSPNLNPIERLWKYMKKEALNSSFCKKFTQFKQTILDFFSPQILRQNAAKLTSLLTFSFHVPTF